MDTNCAVKSFVALALAALAVTGAQADQILCSKCKSVVNTAFCTNCGTPCSKAQNGSDMRQKPLENAVSEGGHSQYYLPYPAGAFRGFTEVLFSPVDILRGAVGLTAEALAGSKQTDVVTCVVAPCITVPVGAVFGCFTMIGDIVVGTLDCLTLGAIGNETDIWKDGISTPYVLERCWIKSEKPDEKVPYWRFIR